MSDNRYQKKLRKQFEKANFNQFYLYSWRKAVYENKQHLTVDFIREFRDYIDLHSPMFIKSLVDKNIVREFDESFYWITYYLMDDNEKVSDDYINEFCLKTLDLRYVPFKAEEAKDIQKSLWGVLARWQDLSKEMIERNIELIDWEGLRETIDCGSIQLPSHKIFNNNYKKYIQIQISKFNGKL